MSPHLRIIVIEDSPVFRRLLPKLLAGEYPWLRNVEFDIQPRPLPQLADYFAFDGAIFDQKLGDARGSEIARQLHELDDTYWLMLMTVAPEHLPGNVCDFVDAVSSKIVGDGVHFELGELLGTARQWIRSIARVKKAAEGRRP